MDERSLKSLRSFCIGALLVVTAVTLIVTAEYLGYNIGLLEDLQIEETTSFFAFTLFGLSIGGIGNMPRGLSQEAKELLREKTRILMIGNILYIGYIIFAILVMKNIYFVLSGLIMEGIYINVILTSRALFNCGLNDTQRQWREIMNGTSSSIKDTSIWWRIKFWVTPFERVPFGERCLRPFNVIFFIFEIIMLMNNGLPDDIFDYLFLFIYIRCCLAILEYILGLYTSMIGTCTGVKEFRESRHGHHNHDSGITIGVASRERYYWQVYITDFHNKREITYKTYKRPYIAEGDEAKVIHGIFSKEVVSINNHKVH